MKERKYVIQKGTSGIWTSVKIPPNVKRLYCEAVRYRPTRKTLTEERAFVSFDNSGIVFCVKNHCIEVIEEKQFSSNKLQYYTKSGSMLFVWYEEEKEESLQEKGALLLKRLEEAHDQR